MMKHIVSLALITTSLATVSCNSLVDSAPPSPSPVAHIEDYYYPLTQIGTSFTYCRKFSSGTDTVFMTMKGKDVLGVMSGNQQCYNMDMTQSHRFLNTYFYSLNDSEAYTIGNISCFTSAPQKWLDLKTPLLAGQTWTFQNSNGSFYTTTSYRATVTQRDVKMKMPNGKIFTDVAEVTYISSKGDTTVKWFAKGVGLIYSTSTNPNSDFGKELRLLAEQ